MNLKMPRGHVVKQAAIAVSKQAGSPPHIYFRSDTVLGPALREWFKNPKRPSVAYAGMVHIIQKCQIAGVTFYECGYVINTPDGAQYFHVEAVS